MSESVFELSDADTHFIYSFMEFLTQTEPETNPYINQSKAAEDAYRIQAMEDNAIAAQALAYQVVEGKKYGGDGQITKEIAERKLAETTDTLQQVREAVNKLFLDMLDLRKDAVMGHEWADSLLKIVGNGRTPEIDALESSPSI